MAASARKLETVAEGGLFRARDLEQLGLYRSAIAGLVREGTVERVARGLYRLTDADVSEHFTVLAVVNKVPHGILCLLTALRIHGIGTQMPREVWIAIDRKDRRPRVRDLPVRVVRFSGVNASYGVQEMALAGVSVRVTSPARTVVDCFRYRNKIGLDVGLEALRDAFRRRIASRDEILQIAEVCRVGTVVRPYVEALSH